MTSASVRWRPAKRRERLLGREMTSRPKTTRADGLPRSIRMRSIVDEQYAKARQVLTTIGTSSTHWHGAARAETLDASESKPCSPGRDLPPERAIIPTWSESVRTKRKRRPASSSGAPKPATSGPEGFFVLLRALPGLRDRVTGEAALAIGSFFLLVPCPDRSAYLRPERGRHSAIGSCFPPCPAQIVPRTSVLKRDRRPASPSFSNTCFPFRSVCFPGGLSSFQLARKRARDRRKGDAGSGAERSVRLLRFVRLLRSVRLLCPAGARLPLRA